MQTTGTRSIVRWVTAPRSFPTYVHVSTIVEYHDSHFAPSDVMPLGTRLLPTSSSIYITILEAITRWDLPSIVRA